MVTSDPLLLLISFIVGSIVGSFLNVCIARIPAGDSIVFPGSHCPVCGTPLIWYENIPIVSYCLLRGTCRSCHVRISPVYPVVEIITAAASLTLFMKFGPTLRFAVTFLFTAALIVITFIDLKHQIIPDVITLPGIPLFLASGVFIMELSFRDALIGCIVGGGSLFFVGFVYKLIKKQEGMGGGDVKLLAMIGGFLGWQSLLFVILISSLFGAVVGVAVMVYQRGSMQTAIPFGPFLSLAAVLYLFCGAHFNALLVLP